ncbi:hypothetical protein VIGAN_04203100 [Vigna angularis var. angularis]|uniref:Uncharacterized protein n=1 Tax=Vigna angularis var. angularis TaxID=157739 RepID=A0A0S3RVL7_PHAAN|nr:hypothetical protein VIGAN_04203100 [Vigna angularis var. angularis]
MFVLFHYCLTSRALLVCSSSFSGMQLWSLSIAVNSSSSLYVSSSLIFTAISVGLIANSDQHLFLILALCYQLSGIIICFPIDAC